MHASAATNRRLDILGRCSLFEPVSSSALTALANEGRLVHRERRQTLFEKGDPADGLFVVGSGRIRLVRNGEREMTVAYRAPGELVGETGWVEGVHHAHGRVVERLEALWIPRKRVEALFDTEPGFGTRFTVWLAERLVAMERRMEALLTRPVESRVAEFLAHAAARHGVPDSRGRLIGVKFTHQEMASYVGSTRETVTLVLGDLKRRGIITTDHRRVVVTDAEALEKLI